MSKQVGGTNEEIAKNIKKAIDEINEYVKDYWDGGYDLDPEPENTLLSEIDEKLSQIRSLTHYIRGEVEVKAMVEKGEY